MVNWYYVKGSDRVGPVDASELKNLFQKNELNNDSYVWKKGFANWEKIKDVAELNFEAAPVVTAPVTPAPAPVEKKAAPKEERRASAVVASSPEVEFNFDWKTAKENDDLFFLKTGNDRRSGAQLYGPYSMKELREALAEKRINEKTLIFSAGMKGWTTVGETPLNPEKKNFNANHTVGSAPLLMVVENSPLPLIALISNAGAKECTLLGAGPFKAQSTVNCSVYSGSTLKARNLKLRIEEYNTKDQKVFCKVLEMDDAAKSLMHNYAG